MADGGSLQRRKMITTFLLQLLYPLKPAKKCSCRILHWKWKFGLTALSQTYIEGRAHRTDVSKSVIVDHVGNTEW